MIFLPKSNTLKNYFFCNISPLIRKAYFFKKHTHTQIMTYNNQDYHHFSYIFTFFLVLDVFHHVNAKPINQAMVHLRVIHIQLIFVLLIVYSSKNIYVSLKIITCIRSLTVMGNERQPTAFLITHTLIYGTYLFHNLNNETYLTLPLSCCC